MQGKVEPTGIHQRYEEVTAEVIAFLDQNRYYKEVGVYYRELADLQDKLIRIQIEAVGELLKGIG